MIKTLTQDLDKIYAITKYIGGKAYGYDVLVDLTGGDKKEQPNKNENKVKTD